jgi:phage shock protein PspC (stress-responsive transcriptional regulator)
MKKTFTINISGTVFHIDDDAYDKLNNYISQINRHFGNDAEAREIVEDIESRISELFQERVKDGNEVINIDHVEEIIRIMGLPEAFDDSKEGEKVKTKISGTRQRKLYRDPDDRVLGGVCSGLGAYFNFDPVIIRLIFVLLVFLGAGSSLIIYLILWIVVPKASNSAQRLEMRGEEVNISNISKNIKEEIQEVKVNYEKYKATGKGREHLDQAGSVAASVLRAILKIVAVIIGIALVFAGIFAIIALITSLFITNEFLGITPFGHGIPQYIDLFMSGTSFFWFWIAIGLVIGIPLLLIAYLGTKLIFRFKSSNGAVGMTSLGLWVIGIILLIFVSVRAFGDFKNVSTSSKQESITTKSDTLYLKLGKDEFTDYLDEHINFDGLRIAAMNGKQFLLYEPRLDIVKSENNDFSMVIKSKARGRDLDKAQYNAREIDYKLELQDSLITFQPWFMLPDKAVWRMQEIEITLKVPENKTIYLSNEMVKILHDIQNTSEMWDGDMGGKYWTMKSNGLELTQRKQAPVVVEPKKNKK